MPYSNFVFGGGRGVQPIVPLNPWTEDTVLRKILDIIGIFRPSQANTFDFAQSDPWHSKEKWEQLGIHADWWGGGVSDQM